MQKLREELQIFKIILSNRDDAFAVQNLMGELGYKYPGVYNTQDNEYLVSFYKERVKEQ